MSDPVRPAAERWLSAGGAGAVGRRMQCLHLGKDRGRDGGTAAMERVGVGQASEVSQRQFSS